jgi:hypothetical protein
MKRTRAVAVMLALPLSFGVLTEGAAAGGGGRSCFENNPTKHGKMRGDVDGNGTRDLAWIAANKHNGRCRYFAKVDLGSDEARKRLYGDKFVFRNFSHVMAMVDVDTVPGREFGIVLQQGASTTFAGLFTMRGGNIERINVHGAGAPDDDLFGYGGSIGISVASDCARNRPDGQVINSVAVLNNAGTHYKVKRRWFQSTGVDLQRTAEDTDKRRVKAEKLHERLYEFRNSPFGSCPGRAPG